MRLLDLVQQRNFTQGEVEVTRDGGERTIQLKTEEGTIELDARLGKGAFGKVYRAHRTGGDAYENGEVAVKAVWLGNVGQQRGQSNFHDSDLDSILLEKELFAQFESGTELITALDDTRAFLVMPMGQAELGQMTSRLQNQPDWGVDRRGGSQSAAIYLFAKAAEKLQKVHDAGIVHGDIKFENLMLKASSSGEHKDVDVLVIDLGTAQAIARDPVGEFGTAGNTAPEGLGGKPFTAASDVWSLGVVLTETFAGAHFFEAWAPERDAHRALTAERQEEFFAWRNAPTDPKYAEHNTIYEKLPRDLRPLIRAMLHPDPEQRPTMSEVASALSESLKGRSLSAQARLARELAQHNRDQARTSSPA